MRSFEKIFVAMPRSLGNAFGQNVMAGLPPNNEDEIGRRLPAQGVHFTGEGSTILWCTVCTENRSPWCANGDVLKLLHELWAETTNAWRVGDFLLMPDHVHLFCSPGPGRYFEVEPWTAYWKAAFAKRCVRRDWRWQIGVFHHRLRSEQEYVDKGRYMRHNPVRKGLVRDPEEWPWQGRVHLIRW